MNKPISANCYSRILNELEQISPKMSRSRKLSWKKGEVDCEDSRRERDIPNTFVPTPYLPHVFRDIDTKPESLPHFTLALTDQKPEGPIPNRIFFPPQRGEIESVNMTYVIPPARIENELRKTRN